MSSENTRTGVNGKAVHESALIARITQWSVNPTVSEDTWGDSDSEGYTNRKGGRKDCTGSLEGKLDENGKVYEVFMPGDQPKLVLWENSADYWAFPRTLITSFSYTVDINNATVNGWTAEFGADGRFYRPGEDGAPSETLPG